MSSSVSLSNFNNIDFSVILNAQMQQESQPLTALQTQQSTLTTQKSTYASLATQVGALETAAAGLSTSSAVQQYSATVSDSSFLTATPTTSALPGNYSVVVSHLAEAQVTVSTSTMPDADTTVAATGGSVKIGDVTVNISQSTTLQGLADQINAAASIPVTAAVVQTGPSAFSLMLTSRSTGAAGAFAITNNALTGGSGVAFAGNAVEAADAALTVNNISITSSSNTLTSAIPGTTLTLLRADPSETIAVSVAASDTTLVTNVKGFVSAYNNLMAFLSDQSTSAANGETGTVAHTPIVNELKGVLRSKLTAAYGSGAFTHLAEIGIGFDQQGNLTLDQGLLTGALDQNRAGVLSLLTGTANEGAFTNGAFGSLQSALDDFTQSGGFISDSQTLLQDQLTRLGSQIVDMQARLAVRQAALQQEYTAADLVMTQLKAQSGNLSSVNGSSSSSNSLFTISS
jgi:flagellar hook-associated protein 2